MSDMAWLGVVMAVVAAFWVATVLIEGTDRKAKLRKGLRDILRWLATLGLLAFATASGGRYALATERHDFEGQILAMLTGATFLWWGIRRIAQDVTEEDE